MQPLIWALINESKAELNKNINIIFNVILRTHQKCKVQRDIKMLSGLVDGYTFCPRKKENHDSKSFLRPI